MTQRGIKQVLTERYYAWRDAEIVAKDDPEVNLSGEGPAYNPRDFDDDVQEEDYEAEDAIKALDEPAREAEGITENIAKVAPQITPGASSEVKPEVRSGA